MTEKATAVKAPTFAELRNKLRTLSEKLGHGSMSQLELENTIRAGFEIVWTMTANIEGGNPNEVIGDRGSVERGKEPLRESSITADIRNRDTSSEYSKTGTSDR